MAMIKRCVGTVKKASIVRDEEKEKSFPGVEEEKDADDVQDSKR